MDSLNTDLERNVTIETSPEDTKKSSNDEKIIINDEKIIINDEKEEPSTSKENIPQQDNKEDNSKKETQSFSKNDEKSELIEKEALIITIESDDDGEVNDNKCILILKIVKLF